MKHIKQHAHEVHAKRHAHLGLHSTSAHPGRAHGGKVHSDVAEDRAVIREMVKPSALNRAHGGATRKASHASRQPGPGPVTPVPVPVPVRAPVAAPPVPAPAPSPMAGPMPGPRPAGMPGAPVRRGGKVTHKKK